MIAVVRLVSVGLPVITVVLAVRQALESALEQVRPFWLDRWTIVLYGRVLIEELDRQTLVFYCFSSVLLFVT